MAGWKLNIGRRRKEDPARGGKSAPSGVVKPLIRETQRVGAIEKNSLPRFQATASDQVTGRGGDRLAATRAKLRHAFTPSQPVADRRMFAGREEVLQTIIRSIEDQRLHTVLYGERGIGKTSLLHMLSQAGVEARYIVVYSSCGANSTFDETFRAAAADIPLLFHSSYAPTTAEAERGSSLADLLPSGPLTPKKFGDLCAKLVGTRVLIILDEFDRCESGAFRRDIAELIKNLSDRLIRVQLVLAGVAADLTELVEHIPSIRRNIFALRVPKMTDQEVLQIISNGEREANLIFDRAAGAFVVSVAQGSPYIASLLCHHAGRAALDVGRNTVVASDVASAIGSAADEFRGRIAKPAQAQIKRLFDSGQGEAMALAARAALAASGAFAMSDVQAAGEVTAVKAQRLIDQLIADRLLMVVEEGGEKRYEFAEDGLPTFLWISWAQQSLRPEETKAEPERPRQAAS